MTPSSLPSSSATKSHQAPSKESPATGILWVFSKSRIIMKPYLVYYRVRLHSEEGERQHVQIFKSLKLSVVQ